MPRVVLQSRRPIDQLHNVDVRYNILLSTAVRCEVFICLVEYVLFMRGQCPRLIDDMRNDLEHDTTKGKTTGNRLREARRMARMLDALAALSQSCATFLDAGVGLVAIVIGPSPVSPRELYLVHFQLPQGNRDNEQELTMKHKDAIHKNVVRAIIQQSGEICGRECQKSRLHILFRAPISAANLPGCTLKRDFSLGKLKLRPNSMPVHLIDVLQKSAPETTRLTNVAQLEDKYPNDAYTWQLWKKQIIGL